MAEVIPLNTFKLVTTTLSAGENTIYTSPSGVTGIILSSQIANKENTTETLTVKIIRSNASEIVLLYNAKIPSQDALNPLTGKLILETGDTLTYVSSTSGMDAVLSVLENANT